MLAGPVASRFMSSTIATDSNQFTRMHTHRGKATVASMVVAIAASMTACGHQFRSPVPQRHNFEHARGSRVEVVPRQPPAASPRVGGHVVQPAANRASPVVRTVGVANQATVGSIRYEPAPHLGNWAPRADKPPSPDHAHSHDDDDDSRHDDWNRNVPETLNTKRSGSTRGDRGTVSHAFDTNEIARREDPRYAPRFTPDGIAWPYPSDKFFRGFGPCIRGHRHSHEAIDLGGVGPNWGVGTPIRSMGKAEVVFIGLGRDNPELFGEPDRRNGTVARGKRDLPRKAVIAPYGEVHFFTRTKGRWRSGNIVVTRVIDGPLKGHIVRYLHMAAVHPDIRTGASVEAGQEIALMGGTGVQESPPHLHLDIEAPDGHRVDVAPIVGLAPTASCEGVPSGIGETELAQATTIPNRYARLPSSTPRTEPPSRGGDDKTAAAKNDKAAIEEPDESSEVGRVWVQRLDYQCAERAWNEDFASGRYESHALVMQLKKGEALDMTLKKRNGDWLPVLSHSGRHLKTKKVRAGKGEQRLYLKATRDTEVTLKVESRRNQPPRDGAYDLMFASSCPKPKVAPTRTTGKKRGRR